ncbi:hypothetical protein DFH06DRAFT_510731 [Mycena polygramma]|nr:hypothetical protein DFH06DRAFT_510731 [Mycena polygramma]
MDDSVHNESDFPSATSSHEDRGSASRMFSSDSDTEHTDAGFASTSNTESLGAASYGSTFFSKAHHFSVSGGTFSNVTHNYNSVSTVLSDFRSIRLGDIDLRQLRFETNRFVRERRSTCRVYAARVEGRKSGVTVTIYEGDGAKDKWREDISYYSSLRHPNVVQLWGVTTSCRIYAAVFHDDLISFEEFVHRRRDSPVLTVYMYAYRATAHWNLRPYFDSNLLHWSWGIIWIRASTGLLCVDPVQQDPMWHLDRLPRWSEPINSHAPTFLDAPTTESAAISSLTLEHYHYICRVRLPQRGWISISTSVTVDLSALLYWPAGLQFQESVPIASLPDAETWSSPWRSWARSSPWNSWNISGDVMDNGWIRYPVEDTLRGPSSTSSIRSYGIGTPWLSQANAIFRRRGITTNLEDYGVVNSIEFWVGISKATEDLATAGYLFLCPIAHVQIASSSFCWPECPAYWSLDPNGINRLTTEKATQLGFPSITLATNIHVSSWDARVYAGLRQFHQGKGFDPDSQDVARHLGHPLYRLTGEEEAPFAYVTDEGPDSWADDENKTKAEEARAQGDSHPDENQQTPSVKNHGTIEMLLSDLPHSCAFRIRI